MLKTGVCKGIFTLIFFNLILPNYGTKQGKLYLNLMLNNNLIENITIKLRKAIILLHIHFKFILCFIIK